MVQCYGCNHVAILATDIAEAVGFYTDVFDLRVRHQDTEHAFLYLGEHQFLAISRVDEMPERSRAHFGVMVRDAEQVEIVRHKVQDEYRLPINPDFRCDFHDPFGNRVQVGDLHDESLIWLLPYREIQKAGVVFDDDADQGDGWTSA